MSTFSSPLIFIPGVFGCMSSEIIPNTGSWQFGFAKHMYVPFIKLLTTKGLVSSKDFFVLYYDWRKSASYNVKNYLIPLLKKVSSITGSKTFDIIAHGTGGLLARYYIEKPPYDFHIKKLFLIGTPNAGFCSSFSYLCGGELHISYRSLDFIHLYLRMHLYKNLPPYAVLPDYLMQTFPALTEMLPSRTYGDYLTYQYNQKQYPIPYKHMSLQNAFLDHLNQSLTPDIYENTMLFVIAGEGTPTIQSFQTVPFCDNRQWIDGKIIDCIYTLDGDGVTTVSSVFALPGIQYSVRSEYENLLLDAAPIYLQEIL
ncbi:MAG: esterase/lipase family protein [Cellulosilyticaceae bacterium]